jgi:hypothetical protein
MFLIFKYLFISILFKGKTKEKKIIYLDLNILFIYINLELKNKHTQQTEVVLYILYWR